MTENRRQRGGDKTAQDKGGRPAHEPTDEIRRQVIIMAAALGLTQAQISLVLNIDPKTLHKYYAVELETATAALNANVAANLYRMATGEGRESLTAAIFWMKCRGGWSEYSPPRPAPEPKTPTPPKPGKKEIAQADAESAAEDTGWHGLVH